MSCDACRLVHGFDPPTQAHSSSNSNININNSRSRSSSSNNPQLSPTVPHGAGGSGRHAAAGTHLAPPACSSAPAITAASTAGPGPVRNILQTWRLSLASLLFFTIFLTDNFGLSSLVVSGGRTHAQKTQQQPINSHRRHLMTSSLSSSHVSSPSSSSSSSSSFHSSFAYSSSDSSASSSFGYGSTSSSYWSLSDYFLHQIINVTSVSGTVSGSGSDSSATCLVSYNISNDVCEAKVKDRDQSMRRRSLVFCGSGYPLYHLIPRQGAQCRVQGSEAECRACLDHIQNLDKQVHAMYCHFTSILTKTDCIGNYSTHWGCNDCKVSAQRSMHKSPKLGLWQNFFLFRHRMPIRTLMWTLMLRISCCVLLRLNGLAGFFGRRGIGLCLRVWQ